MEKRCPECGRSIPYHKGYITWCECGWNIKPYQPEKKPSLFDRITSNLSSKVYRDMYAKMKKTEKLEALFTVNLLFAYILSIMVIVFLFVLGSGALYFAWKGLSNFMWFGASLVLIGITFVSIPKSNHEYEIIDRKQAPTLYKLMDEITDRLGTKRIEGIQINEEFNAFFTQVGIRRKGIVSIGLPLFYILTTKEKIALLCHEGAHGANGDIKRKYVITLAIQILNQWYNLLVPKAEDSHEPLYIVAYPFMKILSLIPLSIGLVLVKCIFLDSQRAEFLADYKASEIAGTDPVISMLDKLHYTDTFYYAMQKATVNRTLFFETYSTVLSAVPDREFERIKRIQELPESILDYTHPPTHYRIDFLRSHGYNRPSLSLSERDISAIEKELKAFEKSIHDKIITLYQSYIGA